MIQLGEHIRRNESAFALFAPCSPCNAQESVKESGGMEVVKRGPYLIPEWDRRLFSASNPEGRFTCVICGKIGDALEYGGYGCCHDEDCLRKQRGWCEQCGKYTRHTHYKKRCVSCKRKFETTRPSQTHCAVCVFGVKECQNPLCTRNKFYGGPNQRFCSSDCERDVGRIRECKICGSAFVPKWPQTTVSVCGPYCRAIKKNKDGQAKNLTRRALIRGANEVESFSIRDLYERDKGKCGLCGEFISPFKEFPDPESMSVDHILPLSRGGNHTLNNVQITHLECNMRKGIGIQ